MRYADPTLLPAIPAIVLVTEEGRPQPLQLDWGVPPDCRPGSEVNNGRCEPTVFCPSGFQRNDKTGWCDPTRSTEYRCGAPEDGEKPLCGPDRFYDKSKGKCVPCPCSWSQGWVVHLSGGGCTFRKAGQPCCPGQALDAPCVSDRVWNDKGECVSANLPHCEQLYGPLAKYDATTGQCTCPDGFRRDEESKTCVAILGPVENYYEDDSLDISWGSFFAGLGAGALALLAGQRGVAWYRERQGSEP